MKLFELNTIKLKIRKKKKTTTKHRRIFSFKNKTIQFCLVRKHYRMHCAQSICYPCCFPAFNIFFPSSSSSSLCFSLLYYYTRYTLLSLMRIHFHEFLVGFLLFYFIPYFFVSFSMWYQWLWCRHCAWYHTESVILFDLNVEYYSYSFLLESNQLLISQKIFKLTDSLNKMLNNNT